MLKPKEIGVKKSIVYQLCYNPDMPNVIDQQKDSKTPITGLIVMLLILLALWLYYRNSYTFTPDTTFTTITGKHISLKDLHGKPMVVTFWATTCPSCIKEIPHLISLYEQFQPQGVEIIGIAMVYDPPNRVVAMSQEKKLPYPVVLDLKGNYAKVFGRVWATPTTLLVNSNGTLAKRVVGPFDLNEMTKRIEQLLQAG